MREILIEGFDPFPWPAQLEGPLTQAVLALSGLTIDRDLGCGGLPNIDVSPALEMSRLYF